MSVEYDHGVITPPELFELVRWIDQRFDAQMGPPKAYITMPGGEKHFYQTYVFTGSTLQDACDLFRRHLDIRDDRPTLYWRMLPHREGATGVRARLIVL